MNRLPVILLSFDVEEFDIPREYGAKVSEEELMEVSRVGMACVLDTLDACGVRATMFMTGHFAECCPEVLCRMVAAGHEIASHGLNHSRFEDGDLEKSRKLLECLSGQEVVGFRAPRLLKLSGREILDAGYFYESSVNPVWIPGRYCNLSKTLLPYREKCGLMQFPISAVPYVRIPLFWLSFKNFPLEAYSAMAAFSARRLKYFNMYSHPWEYNEMTAEKRWRLPAYIKRHAGAEQARRLCSFIERMKKVGQFTTFRQALEVVRS